MTRTPAKPRAVSAQRQSPTLSPKISAAPATTTKGLTLDSVGALRLRPGQDLTVSGALDNVGGTIVADGLAVTGAVNSTGSLLLTGALSGSVISLDGGNVTADSLTSVGSLSNSANVTIAGEVIASGVTNFAGAFSAAALTNSGKLTVSGGLLAIAGAGSVTATE